MDVIDGNTITIVLKDKSRRRITLVAVDAARPGRPFGDMARKKLADLVLNEAIEIWVLPSWGKSKRLTGVVHANGKDINQALIESGIVRYKRPESYSVSDYTACVYRILEGEAREAKRGLWGHATP
jgi:endonuclease YncB( thermonuclease family)